eukprot:CAMPEP_0197535028 /NCGR_PEP_ID=MMETSP1318-20131121/49217_1 /TAXON_ID=552666 /ORGANISM="Partenskyella glossopodia, Strain RCC365" /LENGTH=237 /DNA_ID=CAMNT_0043092499 /DNA_START=84 /DNA_END=794 /DNA_ORIENTATION=-
MLQTWSKEDVRNEYKPVFSPAISRNTLEVNVWRRMGGKFTRKEILAIDQAGISAKDFEQMNVDLKMRAKLIYKEGGTFTEFSKSMRNKKHIGRAARNIGNLYNAWLDAGGKVTRLEGINGEMTNLKDGMQEAIFNKMTFTEFLRQTSAEDIQKDRDGKEIFSVRICPSSYEVCMWRSAGGHFTPREKKQIYSKSMNSIFHRWIKYIVPDGVDISKEIDWRRRKANAAVKWRKNRGSN